MMIPGPYLLFVGDKKSAKVAQGIVHWRPDISLGQLRTTESALDLGIPDMTVTEAVENGAKTLVIGIANHSGRLSKKWIPVLMEALEAGLDIASGLHDLLRNQRPLAGLANERGRTLHDISVHARSYTVGTARPRKGKRCLSVGSDSSVGQMYTMLAMEREMHRRELKATFRATSQTGMLIAGGGVPLDAVIGDFLSGAVEYLTPDNESDHWDLVEGQGSLFHPSYAALPTALLHGAQPDALVLCHEPTRNRVRGLRDFFLPSLEALGDRSLELARLTNPRCTVAGISINTAKMDPASAEAYLAKLEDRMGLPAVDPVRNGVARLVDQLVPKKASVWSQRPMVAPDGLPGATPPPPGLSTPGL